MSNLQIRQKEYHLMIAYGCSFQWTVHNYDFKPSLQFCFHANSSDVILSGFRKLKELSPREAFASVVHTSRRIPVFCIPLFNVDSSLWMNHIEYDVLYNSCSKLCRIVLSYHGWWSAINCVSFSFCSFLSRSFPPCFPRISVNKFIILQLVEHISLDRRAQTLVSDAIAAWAATM